MTHRARQLAQESAEFWLIGTLCDALDAAHTQLETRKPRTITTMEELDALPVGSVIRADSGEVFEKQTDGPYCDGPHDWQSFEGTFWNGETFVFPATVLHEPEAECSGAAKCEAPTHIHGCFAEATG